VKLYYSPGACSLAVHIVLLETGARFQLEKVDTTRHTLTNGSSDYYVVNRKGLVPALEIAGGARLTEGPVIAQYIADESRRTDLMPAAGTLARYRVMEWQNFITSDLHKTVRCCSPRPWQRKLKQRSPMPCGKNTNGSMRVLPQSRLT
jgi:glutathione S-transferase